VIYRGGEVEDSVTLLAAVSMACSASSPSRNSSYGRIKVVVSDDTPARNYGRFGDLHDGERGHTDVVLHGEDLRWKIRSRDQLNRRQPRAP
jgi:hypothetical protein